MAKLITNDAVTFDGLQFAPHPVWAGRIAAKTLYANGYGASVIRADESYGGEDGLYDLAVMLDGDCCYSTPITDDVEGHLTEADVTRLLGEIAALPPANGAAT